MQEVLVSLAVGIIIGIIFKAVKLPVPVPHGWGGLLGLVGMFVGSELVSFIFNHINHS